MAGEQDKVEERSPHPKKADDRKPANGQPGADERPTPSKPVRRFG